MRLTLRTMLAFMDDILEPADAHDVGKKIEESEFATGLMHRMRDVTRRLRVGAPKLHGRGLGLDANTVAEYLDNTLPSERVADFEKVCLESDVHLAEVTAAHQILALVLGEPAEIEATGRQRMYRLPTDAEASPRRDAASKTPDDAARKRRRKKKRRKVEVPDYLREPAEPQRRSRRPVAVLLMLLLAVATAAGGYTWWKNHPDVQVATGGAGGAVNTGPTELDARGAPATSGRADGDVPQDGAADGGDTGEGDRQPGAATPRPDQEPSTDAEDSRPTSVPAHPAKPIDTPSTDAPPTEPDDSTDQPAAPSPNKAPRANASRATRGAVRSRAPRPEVSEEEGDEEPVAAAGEGVGRLISENEVLVRLSGKQARRVPARGTIYAGESLIALPTYRPSVVLASGITVQLYGGAQASFTALDADGVPEIRLDSGRLVVLTAAKPEMQVRLRAGDQLGRVTFGQEDAVLAVEVAHKLPEGADPESEAAPAQVDLYVASGELVWHDEQGHQQALRGKAHWALDRSEPTGKKAEDLPVWIEGSDLTPMERRAAAAVDDYLHVDKPVVPALVELLGHRLAENSILAIQSLALLGKFEPLVPLLNDPTRRRLDNNDIVSLRAAVARGPDAAAGVRKAFESVRGQKRGEELYRMLWGYSPEQLEEGGAAQLIEGLSHADLDYRVLSFWNLHHITGFGYLYKPEATEAKRRTPVQRWRQKLEAGLIVPKASEE